MNLLIRYGFLIATVLALGFWSSVFAKADLSLNVSDISFSNPEPLAGEKIRIFGRVFNLGDQDVYGFVVFSMTGQEMADPQPISVKVGTYDDVFIDSVFQGGAYHIEAEIVAARPADEDKTNDVAVREDFFVDLDSDNDGIGDSKDSDNDNDGLTNEAEKILGTNPESPDSDEDQIIDSKDSFPLDITEWQDNDSDDLGDNFDTDDDNDGLSDQDEVLVYNTNPLKADTDGDGLSDKTEVDLSVGFLKPNRNEWQIAGWGLASMAAAIKGEVEAGNIVIGQLFAAFGFLSTILLILRFVNQRKA